MPLADIGLLKSDEIQLLANSLQPVIALELTPAAETLIQRDLLQALPTFCEHSKRPCFVLTTTGKGAAYVAAWIEDPINLGVCETCAERGGHSDLVYKMGRCKFCYGKLRPKATPEQTKRERMGIRPGWIGFLTLAFALLVFNGCGYYSAPRLIEADGAAYVACSGIVHVSSDGGLFGRDPIYSISFKNDDNVDTVVKGVRNVTITSIPTMTKRNLQTNLPEPKTETDKNGTPFAEGSTFLSGPGDTMMTFRNGMWVPEINTACYGTK